MLIRKRRPGEGDIPSSEITPYELYLDRRRFLAQSATLAGVAALAPSVLGATEAQEDERTPYEDITHYNNYYEFGTGKEDPAKYSGDFEPRPWAVAVEGECSNPGTFALEDF